MLSAASTADRAYAYVKGEILARRFAAHELLSEGQLAEAVGASRTPVREALLRLEGEGLVRLLPKRGALVLPVTVDEMADVMETRRLVESFAVRKVITHRRRLP
jgi:DNA-binding GntR family transcriptional regulator